MFSLSVFHFILPTYTLLDCIALLLLILIIIASIHVKMFVLLTYDICLSRRNVWCAFLLLSTHVSYVCFVNLNILYDVWTCVTFNRIICEYILQRVIRLLHEVEIRHFIHFERFHFEMNVENWWLRFRCQSFIVKTNLCSDR